MSATNALGCGQQRGYRESYRGVVTEINLLKKVRLEIAVNKGFVKRTVDAIVKGAKTGTIGDGKIFILDLAECMRIRTGERGERGDRVEGVGRESKTAVAVAWTEELGRGRRITSPVLKIGGRASAVICCARGC